MLTLRDMTATLAVNSHLMAVFQVFEGAAEAETARRYISPVDLASIYTALGHRDRALTLLRCFEMGLLLIMDVRIFI